MIEAVERCDGNSLLFQTSNIRRVQSAKELLIQTAWSCHKVRVVFEKSKLFPGFQDFDLEGGHHSINQTLRSQFID